MMKGHEAIVLDLCIEVDSTGVQDVAFRAIFADGLCSSVVIAEKIPKMMLWKLKGYLSQFFKDS